MALQYALIIQYLKLLWHWKMHWSYHTWSYCGIVRCTDHTIDTLIIPHLKLLWHCVMHWSYHRHTDHTIPEATMALWDALIRPYLKLLWHCEMHWSYHTWSYYGIRRCTDLIISYLKLLWHCEMQWKHHVADRWPASLHSAEWTTLPLPPVNKNTHITWKIQSECLHFIYLHGISILSHSVSINMAYMY